MKKVLCIVSKDVIRRNIYETTFWQKVIAENKNVDFHVLVESEHADSFSQTLGIAPNISVHAYDRHSYTRWNKILFFLVRTGMCSHSTTTYRRRAYYNKESSLRQLLIKEVIAQTFGRLGVYKRFLRILVQSTMRIDTDLRALFESVNPDLVFAPSLIDTDYDVPAAVEARRRGIRVIGMVRSWDNLNNHGVLAFVPDRFLLQNTWLTKAAQRFQGLHRREVKDVVGLPHYDVYKNPSSLIKPKELFFAELGLDPSKKLLLLGGSDFYYSEDQLPQTLNVLIESKKITQPAQVFFRPHPRSLFGRDAYGVESLPHVHLDGGVSGKTGFSDGDKLVNLLYHADVVIHIASTMAIDAAVFGKPTISINYDSSNKKLPYWNQVGRLHDTFDHYERLIQTGGCATPISVDALAHSINTYLHNPMADAQGRQKILDAFVEPFDGLAGDRLAAILTQEIARC